jgi:hypothetical protein
MRYEDLLEKAYKNYSEAFEKDNTVGLSLLVARVDGKSTYRKPDIEQFEAMVEADESFSKRWNVTIENREMTWEERIQWVMQNTPVEWENLYIVEEVYKPTSPTRVKTIAYNDKTAKLYI